MLVASALWIWLSSSENFISNLEATFLVISSRFGVECKLSRQIATVQEPLMSSFWLYLPLEMYKKTMVRVATMIGSPGITSSCLMSQCCAESWSLMLDWDSWIRSALDLWGIEGWEQVCGLTVVTSGVCQDCLLVILVTGLDMIDWNELWKVG